MANWKGVERKSQTRENLDLPAGASYSFLSWDRRLPWLERLCQGREGSGQAMGPSLGLAGGAANEG